MKWYVTQTYSWTFVVEADSESEAIAIAADMELNGSDLLDNLDNVIAVAQTPVTDAESGNDN